ncbi:MAG: DJ-1 family protein [bacterium]|nr:DJ-1 family protein [bacterium]
MSKRVLVPIADGCEELEAVAIIDVLKRAGADVVVASVDRLQVTASRGVKLVADGLIGECVDDRFDLIALPGGMPGAEHLRDSVELVELLKRQRREDKLYAAICAAPVVALQPHGLLEGRKATCHPGRHDVLVNAEAAHNRLVVDGNLTTSQGPGTAVEFALKLVERLFGEEKARDVAGPMVVEC